jgi:hypothetical protein
MTKVCNPHLSVPLTHLMNMKEEYDNINLLVDKIQYGNYRLNICADLEIVNGATKRLHKVLLFFR